jgi:hypothetical protein
MQVVRKSLQASSQLDASLAKRFTWLPGKGLRNTFKTQDNPDSGCWWLVKIYQEYPVWAHASPMQELKLLFELVGKTMAAR